MKQDLIRNLAIIAHVDHGKTTLVDAMLKQSGIFHSKQVVVDRVMDRNDLERERGITILSKNTSIMYKDYRLNIVDTPGHADFGGEVERIVQMVNGVLLVIDAVEGPMPQTRFVLKKALQANLSPIVVINKVDRSNAEPETALDRALDLFIDLGASEGQLEFPYVFANATDGKAGTSWQELSSDLQPLFDMIIDSIPAPSGDTEGPLQMGVSMIDYDSYTGRQAVGRINSGIIREKDEVVVAKYDGTMDVQQISGLFVFDGLRKVKVTEISAGQIALVAGVEDINVGDTITCPTNPQPLKFTTIDEPMVSMSFQVNCSPFAGQEGSYVTARNLIERLRREAESDVSLRVNMTSHASNFNVEGRGELHLAILIEKMRREGYEFEVSRPSVITKNINGQECEPIEEIVIDVPDEYVGVIIESLGERKGELKKMVSGQNGRTNLTFNAPTRSLFGFRSQFLTDTKGLGIMNHSFLDHQPLRGAIKTRIRGSLVAFESGVSTTKGIENAQVRGELFIKPGEKVYKGQIIVENSRNEDLEINVCKQKKLTNIRSSTADISTKLNAPREMTLDTCLEFISDDELVEITPKSIRMRKE